VRKAKLGYNYFQFMKTKNTPRIIAIGEILLDIYKEKGYENIGGAPFNFAFHTQSLTRNTSFISKIGNDQLGSKIQNFLTEHNFPNNHLQIDKARPTGHVLVSLGQQGVPTFEIVENVAYDFIDSNKNINNMLENNEIDLIYFGTLAQRSETSKKTIRDLLASANNCLKFLDINLRPSTYSNESIDYSLHTCNVLKLNDHELKTLNSIYSLGENNKEIIQNISSKFKIDTINLTQGSKNCLLYSENSFFSKDIPQIEPIDTVGAGDAFSSILALGLLKKWHPNKILDLATSFASQVCLIKGAISTNAAFYNKIKKDCTND
jgi:fructokinase